MRKSILLIACFCSLCSGSFAQETKAPIPPYQWSLYTPQYLNDALEKNLIKENQKIEAITKLPKEQINFQNSFLALEEAVLSLEGVWGAIINHIKAIDSSQAIRDLEGKWTEPISSFFSGIPLNKKLYQVLKACPINNSLTALEKRLASITLESFEDQGILLLNKDKKRCMEIQTRLAQCSQDFENKVLDSKKEAAYIVRNEKDLRGLPDFAIQAAKNDAIKLGISTESSPAWRFGNNPMLTSLAIQRGDSAKLREGVWRQARSIAAPGKYDTEPLINEILALRQELALLLGSQHFFDLTTKRRMAKSSAKVDVFLEKLLVEIKPIRDQLVKNILDFNKQDSIQAWDLSYYIEKMNQQKYAFDSESLRPYFEKDHVLQSLFSLCSQLFNIEIRQAKTTHRSIGSSKPLSEGGIEVAHPEIQYYHVYDRTKQAYLGGFYLDLFPREGKRGGACLMPMTAKLNHKVAIVIANLSRQNPNTATLFSLYDVTTLFHEFGHLLHFMLSEVPIQSLSGTAVAWDFVELPSQWLENTLYSPEVLTFVGKHYKTGEPIPRELIDKMLMVKKLNSPFKLLSNLKLSLLDSTLHSRYASVKEKGIDALDAEISKSIHPAGIVYSEIPASARSLGHIFSGGYAGGYYSYLWAETLEADVSERFNKEGVLNPQLGDLFRCTILSQGNAQDADILFQAFMGRDVSLAPLLQRNGKSAQ